jgi:hypothetical protein
MDIVPASQRDKSIFLHLSDRYQRTAQESRLETGLHQVLTFELKWSIVTRCAGENETSVGNRI